MNAGECLKRLLMPGAQVEEQSELLEEYLSFKLVVGRNVGAPKRLVIKWALGELFKALPDERDETRSRLRAVLDEIQGYQLERRAHSEEIKKKQIGILQSVAPGTAIVIQNGNREEVVYFLEVKRTRFICESPDGRYLDVPSGLFVRLHEGKAPPRKGEDERLHGELVRALAGRNHAAARQTILAGELKYVPALLSELSSALRRIKDAPVGFSQGVFRNCLGPVKKVNPLDEALAKRIPEILKKLSEGPCGAAVRKAVVHYPEDKVRRLCQEALAS